VSDDNGNAFQDEPDQPDSDEDESDLEEVLSVATSLDGADLTESSDDEDELAEMTIDELRRERTRRNRIRMMYADIADRYESEIEKAEGRMVENVGLCNTFADKIKRLTNEINAENDEGSPVYFYKNQELIFLSNKDQEKNTYKIFHSILSGDRKWSPPTEVSNLGVFNEEMPTIEVVSEDGRLFQFRRGLKYSETTGSLNGWSEPLEFDNNLSSTLISSHFYINENETRILYAQNVGTKRNPNLDLFEIYKDEKENWSRALPLASINTIYNEDSPFLTKDGNTLYFSSDGLRAMGGFDILKTELDLENNVWKEPVNMGFPINTLDDETQFKLNPDEHSGYFTSNRVNTYGKMDIFFFWYAEKINIKGRITDEDENPIQARVYLRNRDYLDMYYYAESDQYGYYSTQLPSDGEYDAEIRLSDNTEFHQKFEFSELQNITKNFVLTIDSKKVPLEQVVLTEQEQEAVIEKSISHQEVKVEDLGNKFRSSDIARIRNIYFATGKSELKSESEIGLESLKNLLEDNLNMKIEISGHTDNIGSAASNLYISKKRAESVKNWLKSNGIDADRIKTIGYGESRPIASNDDEVEGRELNRRIEIRVL